MAARSRSPEVDASATDRIGEHVDDSIRAMLARHLHGRFDVGHEITRARRSGRPADRCLEAERGNRAGRRKDELKQGPTGCRRHLEDTCFDLLPPDLATKLSVKRLKSPGATDTSVVSYCRPAASACASVAAGPGGVANETGAAMKPSASISQAMLRERAPRLNFLPASMRRKKDQARPPPSPR